MCIIPAVHMHLQRWGDKKKKKGQKMYVLAEMCKSVYGQITHKHANPLICQASYTNPVPVFKGTSQDEGGWGGGMEE